MYDWIIEADIYRLEKAITASDSRSERAQLERLVHERRLMLLAKRALAKPA